MLEGHPGTCRVWTSLTTASANRGQVFFENIIEALKITSTTRACLSFQRPIGKTRGPISDAITVAWRFLEGVVDVKDLVSALGDNGVTITTTPTAAESTKSFFSKCSCFDSQDGPYGQLLDVSQHVFTCDSAKVQRSPKTPPPLVPPRTFIHSETGYARSARGLRALDFFFAIFTLTLHWSERMLDSTTNLSEH